MNFPQFFFRGGGYGFNSRRCAYLCANRQRGGGGGSDNNDGGAGESLLSRRPELSLAQCDGLVGKAYPGIFNLVRGALLLARKEGSGRRSAYFCSAFASLVYQRLGLLAQRKNPKHFMPGDFADDSGEHAVAKVRPRHKTSLPLQHLAKSLS